MSKDEIKRILEMPTVTTSWGDCPGGVEIKDIEYGIEDYCLCVTNTMTSNPRAHRVKIHYAERPYIKIDSSRVYMDNCLRC